jgi:hypothetical protein
MSRYLWNNTLFICLSEKHTKLCIKFTQKGVSNFKYQTDFHQIIEQDHFGRIVVIMFVTCDSF